MRVPYCCRVQQHSTLDAAILSSPAQQLAACPTNHRGVTRLCPASTSHELKYPDNRSMLHVPHTGWSLHSLSPLAVRLLLSVHTAQLLHLLAHLRHTGITRFCTHSMLHEPQLRRDNQCLLKQCPFRRPSQQLLPPAHTAQLLHLSAHPGQYLRYCE